MRTALTVVFVRVVILYIVHCTCVHVRIYCTLYIRECGNILYIVHAYMWEHCVLYLYESISLGGSY